MSSVGLLHQKYASESHPAHFLCHRSPASRGLLGSIFFQFLGDLPTRAPDPRTLLSLFCLGSRLLTEEIEKLPRLPTQGPWVGK